MAKRPNLSSQPRRATLRVDELGFIFDGESFEGFPDRPSLPDDVRAQVARWAAAAGTASDAQRALAATVSTRRHVEDDELLAILDQENRLLDDARFASALDRLDDEERARILRPHAFLGRDLVWPLNVAEASRVLVHVTEHQLRDWDNAGVCRAARWGRGGYRGYFRSQLLMAVLIFKLIRQGYRLDQIREDLGLKPRPAEAADLMAVAEAVADTELSAAG